MPSLLAILLPQPARAGEAAPAALIPGKAGGVFAAALAPLLTAAAGNKVATALPASPNHSLRASVVFAAPRPPAGADPAAPTVAASVSSAKSSRAAPTIGVALPAVARSAPPPPAQVTSVEPLEIETPPIPLRQFRPPARPSPASPQILAIGGRAAKVVSASPCAPIAHAPAQMLVAPQTLPAAPAPLSPRQPKVADTGQLPRGAAPSAVPARAAIAAEAAPSPANPVLGPPASAIQVAYAELPGSRTKPDEDISEQAFTLPAEKGPPPHVGLSAAPSAHNQPAVAAARVTPLPYAGAGSTKQSLLPPPARPANRAKLGEWVADAAATGPGANVRRLVSTPKMAVPARVQSRTAAIQTPPRQTTLSAHPAPAASAAGLAAIRFSPLPQPRLPAVTAIIPTPLPAASDAAQPGKPGEASDEASRAPTRAADERAPPTATRPQAATATATDAAPGPAAPAAPTATQAAQAPDGAFSLPIGAPLTAATAPAKAAATDSVAAPAAAPAAQLGQAVTGLHIRPDGSSQLTLHLHPAELGRVDVHIERAPDGTARIDVAVERPETLRNLQTDIAHLHLALDRAGLGGERSISLHLAQPVPHQAEPQAGGAATGGTGGGGQGAFQNSGRPPPAWPAGSGATPFATPPETEITLPPPQPGNAQAGLNITA